MNAKVNAKPCPFCGNKVIISHGIINAPFWFFKCHACGATVSFDNAVCNMKPEEALEFWNRRTK